MGSSLMKSPLLSIVKGYISGGATGAGAGLIESKNPALGAAMNATGATSASKTEGDSLQSQGSDALKMPNLGDSMQSDNPMSRRLGLMDQDPEASIYDGLDALKDPSIPSWMRQQYAEPLLRAKHFKIGQGE